MKCTTKKAAFDSSDINQYHETVPAPDGKPAQIAHVVQAGNVINLMDALRRSLGREIRRATEAAAHGFVEVRPPHHRISQSTEATGVKKKRADDAVPRLMSRLLRQKHPPSSLRGSFHQHDFRVAPFL
jgi:hypothetical protein